MLGWDPQPSFRFSHSRSSLDLFSEAKVWHREELATTRPERCFRVKFIYAVCDSDASGVSQMPLGVVYTLKRASAAGSESGTSIAYERKLFSHRNVANYFAQC